MSKGGGSTRTINTMVNQQEYAKPFLEYGLSQAKDLFSSAQPQYYPGQTTVGFSPESEMALSGIRDQAITGSPFIKGVQDVVMQNLMGTNPLQAAAFRPVVELVLVLMQPAGSLSHNYQL